MLEGSKFLLHQEIFAKSEHERQQAELTKTAVKEGVEAYAEVVREKSTEFSPEMMQFVSAAKLWHEVRFKDLGIPDAQLSNHVYKIPGLQSGHGETRLGVIQIADLEAEVLVPTPIEEAVKAQQFLPLEVTGDNLFNVTKDEAALAVRQYLEALIIGHEFYHSSGVLSTSATVENKNTGDAAAELATFKVTRQGAAYSSARSSPAIEEGLAVSSEKEIEPMVAEHFPLGAEIYQKLVDYVMQQDPRLRDDPNKGIRRKLISIRNFDGINVSYENSRYLGSEMLVNYLKEEIPNFPQLVEEFRVHGKRLPLARAVEKRFGAGSYRTIFSATENEAIDVWQALMATEAEGRQPLPE